jgi:pectate lyase
MNKRAVLLSLSSLFALASCGIQVKVSSASVSASSALASASSLSSSEIQSSFQSSPADSASSSAASSSQSASPASVSSAEEYKDGADSNGSGSLDLKTEPVISDFRIGKEAGLFESACVCFGKDAAAQNYEVSYQRSGETSWTKIDKELIREYPGCFRADAVGLKEGTYKLKVVPFESGTANESKALFTSDLSVKPFKRDGYAFKNGTASGAYNEDGTLKANALVLYCNPETINTITADIVTSSSGSKTSATSLQSILTLLKKGTETRSVCVRLLGNITLPSSFSSADNSKICAGDLVVDCNNKYSLGVTLEGIGNDAVANGWGIRFKNAINCELRNIGFMNCSSKEGDDVGLQQSNSHIWVHNCDMFYGNAGSDADQVKGDGALDTKKSNYVTLSYNHFWDCGKCNLLGLSEGEYDLYVTYDHNWYDHSDSRHPRVRFYQAHVYNNYYDGNSKYGIGACLGSSVFAESNCFRNCKYPMLTSMQGTDYNNSLTNKGDGIFSNENGGSIKAFNNRMEQYKSFIPYAEGSTSFDAYEAQTREEKVPENVIAKQGGAKYSNFDTDSALIDSYAPDAAEEVPALVTASAGRMEQGDFQWKFNNAIDDYAYSVNTALKAAVTSYKSEVVSF